MNERSTNRFSTADIVSRRTMLALLGIGGVSLAAGACTDTSGSSGGSSTMRKGTFHIPDSGARLPKGDARLRWVDSGDQKAQFFNAFFSAYRKKHPNVKVQYQGTNWNTIQQEITLGLRNGTAPDVFQLPIQIPNAEAVKNGWVGAVDDIVPQWKQVKTRFPAGTFADGVTDFDGKTYGLPLVSNNRILNLLLFNTELTQKAGYDLENQTLSWDDFRTLARKVTKQGGGKYYGVIFGTTESGSLSQPLSNMAEMAGVHGGVDAGSSVGNGEFGGINWLTGQFNYTTDANIELIEMLLALKRDGSVFPGSTSLDMAGARGRMPQGGAAMMFDGPWAIAPWQNENASFKFGLSLPPQQNPQNVWPLGYGPGGGRQWFYSAKSQVGAVIGDIYSYLATLDGQTQWVNFNGAANPAVFPSAFAQAKLDRLQRKALDLGLKYRMIRPDPAVRNPDVTMVYKAAVPVQPNFSDTLVGLFTGQITSGVRKAMKDLQDRSEQALEKAIQVAKTRGAKVSRDDWVFADWNPRKGYTRLYRK